MGDVKIAIVQYVMDIIYSGSGNITGDTEEYRRVLDMLKIDTIVVDEMDSTEGCTLDESVVELSDFSSGSKSETNVAKSGDSKEDQEKEMRKRLEKKQEDLRKK